MCIHKGGAGGPAITSQRGRAKAGEMDKLGQGKEGEDYKKTPLSEREIEGYRSVASLQLLEVSRKGDEEKGMDKFSRQGCAHALGKSRSTVRKGGNGD